MSYYIMNQKKQKKSKTPEKSKQKKSSQKKDSKKEPSQKGSGRMEILQAIGMGLINKFTPSIPTNPTGFVSYIRSIPLSS